MHLQIGKISVSECVNVDPEEDHSFLKHVIRNVYQLFVIFLNCMLCRI